MSDLIDHARHFATEAHTDIGHRRKYTQQPYAVHLKAVAQLVSEVTDTPEVIAAAWLHDTVEDTTATFQDLELEFSLEVAQLVSEVTDVSKVSDGNRAVRKAIDRAHLAQASPRGQTIKLADLIDNCRDICKHDEKFARTFCTEMAAILEVLHDGDPRLLKRARKTLQTCLDQLGISLPEVTIAAAEPDAASRSPLAQAQLQRGFMRVFTVNDLAEPLRSYDDTAQADTVRERMAEQGQLVAGVRRDGRVSGYVLVYDLVGGTVGEAGREFRGDQIVQGVDRLSSVIEGLTRHDHVFVEVLGDVGGVVARADIQKPAVRMWLFGIITITEMTLAARLREVYPDDSWREHLSPARFAGAEELFAERRRRDQRGDLIECLQFSDKAEILLSRDSELAVYGFRSRKEAKRVIKQLESLRNNLAHAQDIVTHDWPQIVRMSRNLELRAQGDGAGR